MFMQYTAILIIIILWGVLSSLSIIEFSPYCKELSTLKQFAVVLVCLIGGPIFGINQILTEILNIILPGGWDDNDTPKY